MESQSTGLLSACCNPFELVFAQSMYKAKHLLQRLLFIVQLLCQLCPPRVQLRIALCLESGKLAHRVVVRNLAVCHMLPCGHPVALALRRHAGVKYVKA